MAWNTDFNEGAANLITAGDASFLIQGVGATALFIWIVYVVIKSYNEWTSKSTTSTAHSSDLLLLWLRALATFSVVLFLLVT